MLLSEAYDIFTPLHIPPLPQLLMGTQLNAELLKERRLTRNDGLRVTISLLLFVGSDWSKCLILMLLMLEKLATLLKAMSRRLRCSVL